MRALDDTDLLLDLLREAGEEPVTLEELEVVGVRDPAAALLSLELAGHAVHRVFDNRAMCVRLAPFDGAVEDPVTEEPFVVTTRPASRPGPSRGLVVAVALLLLGLLVVSRR